MGNGHSSIDIEEAARRISIEEQEVIREWLRQQTNHSMLLEEKMFCRAPTIRSIPNGLAKRIFNTMSRMMIHVPDTTSESSTQFIKSAANFVIDWREEVKQVDFDGMLKFMAVVMLSKGKIEEKIELVLDFFLTDENLTKDDIFRTLTDISIAGEKSFGLDILLQHPTPTQSTQQRVIARNEMIETIATSISRHSHSIRQNLRQWLKDNIHIVMFVCYFIESDKRRPEILEEFILMPPPEFTGPSSEIFTAQMAFQLEEWLPVNCRHCTFSKLFDSRVDGNLLSALIHRSTVGKPGMEPNRYIIVEDSAGNIFGAFIDEVLRKNSDEFYGGSACFLFTLHPKFGMYKRSEARKSADESNYVFSDHDLLGFGGHAGRFGLSLDKELRHGTTHACSTYESPPLTFGTPFVHTGNSSSDIADSASACQSPSLVEVVGQGVQFEIQNVEVWGFIKEEQLEVTEFLMPWEENKLHAEDLKDHEKGVLGNKLHTAVLEMLDGCGYSRNLADPVNDNIAASHQPHKKKTDNCDEN